MLRSVVVCPQRKLSLCRLRCSGTNVSAALSHTAKSQQESVDAMFTVWGSCLPPLRHSGRVSGVSDTSPGSLLPAYSIGHCGGGGIMRV